jgi:hypothetical protein
MHLFVVGVALIDLGSHIGRDRFTADVNLLSVCNCFFPFDSKLSLGPRVATYCAIEALLAAARPFPFLKLAMTRSLGKKMDTGTLTSLQPCSQIGPTSSFLDCVSFLLSDDSAKLSPSNA